MAERDDDSRLFNTAGNSRYDNGWTPRPDPTLLTTAQTEREIHALHELLRAIIEGMDNKFTTRLEAMDKAINLLQVSADRVPLSVDTKVSNLQALHNEKFSSIEKQLTMQFGELDKRMSQTTESSTTAINAALQAAKEAVGQQNSAFAQATSKSELATSKQLEQLGQIIGNTTTSLNEKIDASTARGETAVASLRAELLPQITGERTRGDIGAGRQLGQGAMGALMLGGVAAVGTVVAIIGFIIARVTP